MRTELLTRGMFRQDFDDLVEEVKQRYDEVSAETMRLRQQLHEWDQDEEIQKVKQLAEEYRKHSLQQLTDVELQRIAAFRDKHWKECRNPNKFRYELTGTGIGTAVKIQCPVCGVEEDVTDLDSW